MNKFQAAVALMALLCGVLVFFLRGGGEPPIARERELWQSYDVTITEVTTCIELEEIKPLTMIVTGYAPLDPKAKEGVCYSGDPTVTASGTRTTPRRTIAADKAMPFGTRVRIEGFDETLVVEDRGGKINGNRIDICFATQKEALAFGRKKLAVLIMDEI